MTIARAEAFANIALAKYWGKSNRGDNLTAVSSLSMTLDGLSTRTEVRLDTSLPSDVVELDGQRLAEKGSKRVSAMLDTLRKLSGKNVPAYVTSWNNFPTAAGLASSASGFAALAVAGARAYGVALDTSELSALARRSSASAGRSLFEGFSELRREENSAVALAPRNHWDVAMVVAIVRSGPKPITSTGGMLHTASTSPYYPAWVQGAEAVFAEVREGVLARDFERVATYMEHSTRLMHATMITSLPPVLYLRGATVELMHAIAERRAQGTPEAYTMDAGPNVKVLTPLEHVAKTAAYLRSVPEVEAVLVCPPGGAARTLSLDGDLKSATEEIP